MAIINSFKRVMRTVPETQYAPAEEVPKLCPICGDESLFEWRVSEYGTRKISCFSHKCAEPVKIGMILGDTNNFSMKEYNTPGSPTVTYKAAGNEYSEELRSHIHDLLVSWGFVNISFINPNPDDVKSERDTVIKATHKSPLINIAFRRAPKTQRVLCFINKYGVISLEIGHYGQHYEKRYYMWDRGYDAVYAYLKETGKDLGFSKDKLIVLPHSDSLKIDAGNQILQAQKNAKLRIIIDYRYKIKSLRSDIKRIQGYIKTQKESYKTTFGEECPNDPIDEG